MERLLGVFTFYSSRLCLRRKKQNFSVFYFLFLTPEVSETEDVLLKVYKKLCLRHRNSLRRLSRLRRVRMAWVAGLGVAELDRDARAHDERVAVVAQRRCTGAVKAQHA